MASPNDEEVSLTASNLLLQIDETQQEGQTSSEKFFSTSTADVLCQSEVTQKATSSHINAESKCQFVFYNKGNAILYSPNN